MKHIEESAIIDEDVAIGEGSRIWHWTHVLSGARIGKGCTISQGCMIGKGVSVGNNVKIQNNVSVFTAVSIEDDVFIGPSVVFTNVKSPRSFIEQKDNFKPTIVRKGCSIGANATIVCGVNIGMYAMIGAGSVITKDVPDFALVYGNPARIMGYVDMEGKIVKRC